MERSTLSRPTNGASTNYGLWFFTYATVISSGCRATYSMFRNLNANSVSHCRTSGEPFSVTADGGEQNATWLARLQGHARVAMLFSNTAFGVSVIELCYFCTVGAAAICNGLGLDSRVNRFCVRPDLALSLRRTWSNTGFRSWGRRDDSDAWCFNTTLRHVAVAKISN